MHYKDQQLRAAPTDLSNFLGCKHRSALDLRAATGEFERPARYGPMLDELRARGLAHEHRYLEKQRAEGVSRRVR